MEFDWDEGNLEHIAKHGFDDVECEEVFFDENAISAPAYNYKGEKRQAIIGKTEGGFTLQIRNHLTTNHLAGFGG